MRTLVRLGIPPAGAGSTVRGSPPGGIPLREETSVPFVMIAPRGSRDLDQAMYVRCAGHGYRAGAAGAELGAFVRPVGESFGGAIVEVTQVGGLVRVIGPAILAPAVGQCCAGAEVTVGTSMLRSTRRGSRW